MISVFAFYHSADVTNSLLRAVSVEHWFDVLRISSRGSAKYWLCKVLATVAIKTSSAWHRQSCRVWIIVKFLVVCVRSTVIEVAVSVKDIYGFLPRRRVFAMSFVLLWESTTLNGVQGELSGYVVRVDGLSSAVSRGAAAWEVHPCYWRTCVLRELYPNKVVFDV